MELNLTFHQRVQVYIDSLYYDPVPAFFNYTFIEWFSFSPKEQTEIVRALSVCPGCGNNYDYSSRYCKICNYELFPF